jgi:hypothetical protein
VDSPGAQTVEHPAQPVGGAERRFETLLDQWALEYGVESALEGPADGSRGNPTVRCLGLARRGIRVTSAWITTEKAAFARGAYMASTANTASAASAATAGGQARIDTRVLADPMRAAEELPSSDLVITYDALAVVADWREYLRALARLAGKVLVVVVRNPQYLSVTLPVVTLRAATRLGWEHAFQGSEAWQTEALAPVLWSLGRVRDHVYLKGEGWASELLSALLRRSPFEAPEWLRSRASAMHAFVVDMRPRTPQARRHLVRVG